MAPPFGTEGFALSILGPESHEVRAFPPGVHEVSIGRDPGCHVQLAETAVSRRHLLIKVFAEGLVVEDTSANGTLVDGTLVKHNLIQVGRQSTIRIGNYQIQIHGPGEISAPQNSAPLTRVNTPQSEWLTEAAAAALEPRDEQSAPELVESPITRPHTRPSPPAVPRPSTRPDGSRAQVSAQVRRKLHRSLVDHLDLIKVERSRLNPKLLRAKVELALKQIVSDHAHLIPRGTDTEALIRDLSDEAVGLGPLEELLADEAVNEIMVVDPDNIYIERAGQIELTPSRFTDDESLRSTLERIVMPLGRRIDESAPMLDARLPDGSRVNAIIPPLATRGPCITIRKFAKSPLTIDKLIEMGSISKRMAVFLQRSVQARKNIVVAGGTGSGKTTLLNILSASCAEDERIVTIEDSAELQLRQNHVVTLEARPANMEGKGEVSIRDLVKNAMRMRPDRIIVGECRGGEALDMLMAMNTGHDGSMTTTHANSPAEALRRLESLALMSAVDLPSMAIREQIAFAIDLIVHQTRFADGSRRVTSVTEVTGLEDGQIETREIFGFRRKRTTPDGKVHGDFYATGYLPSYLDEFIALGIVTDEDIFL